MSLQSVIERINLTSQLRTAVAEHEKIMILLRSLKAGEISLDDVSVNNVSWSLNGPSVENPPFRIATPEEVAEFDAADKQTVEVECVDDSQGIAQD